jgi:hypothetical protein
MSKPNTEAVSRNWRAARGAVVSKGSENCQAVGFETAERHGY